jgi:hypothetical protein
MHLHSSKKIAKRKSGLVTILAYSTIFTILISLTTACKKDPGQGGLASISGKVYGYDINSSGIVTDSGYVGDVKVYISYDNNQYADDDVNTSYTGDFSFQGLQKGKYTIYTYSECDSCNFNQTPVVQEFEITSTKQDATLPDFVIYN